MSAMTRRKKAEAARAVAAIPERPRERHRYWLVQRLRKPYVASGRTGFDTLFACDYMGSAEFEWGAIPKALQSVRAAKRLVVEPREVTWAGVTRTVWFVGPEQGMAEKIADWDAWRVEENCRAKESPPGSVRRSAGTWRTGTATRSHGGPCGTTSPGPSTPRRRRSCSPGSRGRLTDGRTVGKA
jgi:hypothetical protein